jgi:predicted nucleic acid-binding protein
MFLLDTNVVSELRKARAGKADANVVAWAEQNSASDMFVSVITIQELEIGVLRVERRDTQQGALLRSWLEDQVLTSFAERTLTVNLAIARRSAELHVPDPRPVRDAFIAATALVHQMTVVTRKVRDFAPTGVDVFNPWNDPAAKHPGRSGKVADVSAENRQTVRSDV